MKHMFAWQIFRASFWAFVLLMCLLLAGVLIPHKSYGDGTVTVTAVHPYQLVGEEVRMYFFDWEATDNDSTRWRQPDAQRQEVCGFIHQAVTNPGDDAAAPTDNYDVYFTIADGVDVFSNGLENRDTVNSELVRIEDTFYCGLIKFELGGNTNADATGRVRLYVRRP